MSKPDDTFLGRWSRKKLEPEIEQDAVSVEEEGTPPDETLSDQEILDQLELPDPDDLKEGDDFAAFMNGAVPDHLRKRALRKLWLSNPALANLDGLVEYGEDYTDAAMVPEVLNTAYKVGRGFLKDILEEPEEDLEEDLDPVSDEHEPPEELSAPSDVAVVNEEPASESEPHSEEQLELAEQDAPKHIPRPRMVFTTD